MTRYSICSYSFKKSFEEGAMDIFAYVDWCKAAECTQLDPWMRHLAAGYDDDAFLDQVKEKADQAGLPFGCLAVDDAHIYEPSAAARAENRRRAYRWLDIAERLGAAQVRIDAGGRDISYEEIEEIVVDGYADLVARARPKNLEVIIENHWGPTKEPENMAKLLAAVDGLGLLFDTANWPEGEHEEAWRTFASYASLTHLKTFTIDETGSEPDWDLPLAVNLLREADYDGSWGVEYEGKSGDDQEMVQKSLNLIKRLVEGEM